MADNERREVLLASLMGAGAALTAETLGLFKISHEGKIQYLGKIDFDPQKIAEDKLKLIALEKGVVLRSQALDLLDKSGGPVEKSLEFFSFITGNVAKVVRPLNSGLSNLGSLKAEAKTVSSNLVEFIPLDEICRGLLGLINKAEKSVGEVTAKIDGVSPVKIKNLEEALEKIPGLGPFLIHWKRIISEGKKALQAGVELGEQIERGLRGPTEGLVSIVGSYADFLVGTIRGITSYLVKLDDMTQKTQSEVEEARIKVRERRLEAGALVEQAKSRNPEGNLALLPAFSTLSSEQVLPMPQTVTRRSFLKLGLGAAAGAGLYLAARLHPNSPLQVESGKITFNGQVYDLKELLGQEEKTAALKEAFRLQGLALQTYLSADGPIQSALDLFSFASEGAHAIFTPIDKAKEKISQFKKDAKASAATLVKIVPLNELYRNYLKIIDDAEKVAGKINWLKTVADFPFIRPFKNTWEEIVSKTKYNLQQGARFGDFIEEKLKDPASGLISVSLRLVEGISSPLELVLNFASELNQKAQDMTLLVSNSLKEVRKLNEKADSILTEPEEEAPTDPKQEQDEADPGSKGQKDPTPTPDTGTKRKPIVPSPRNQPQPGNPGIGGGPRPRPQ